MKPLIALCIALTLAGCAASHGFDRGALQRDFSDATVQITDETVREALEKVPQIEFPVTVAVWFAEPKARTHIRSVGWARGEREVMWLMPLINENIAKDVILLNGATVQSTDLAGLRLAAARHGADALLVIESVTQVDRYTNWSAFLYLTIVGAWTVPGTHSEALSVVSGALWDVKNEYLYAAAQSEATHKRVGPAMVLRDLKTIREARRVAMNGFQREFLKRMRNLYGQH